MATAGGFGYAPVTKAVLLLTIAASVLLQAARNRSYFIPPYISLFAQTFVFEHPGELLLGAILLYNFRVFERQQGSAKYGAYVAVVCAASSLLRLFAQLVSGVQAASGPYGIVFAQMLLYVLDLPPASKFRLFNVELTDKVFLYMASLQLLCNHVPSSLLAGVCGFVAGIIHRSNVLGIADFQIPKSTATWLQRVIGHWFDNSPPLRLRQRPSQQSTAAAQPSQNSVETLVQPSAPPMSQANAQAVVPDPSAVEQLEQMGFDRERALRALQQTGNDVAAAISLLV